MSKYLAFALLLLATHTAAADPDQGGLSVSAGGGVAGFTDQTLRGTTSPAGLLDLRVVYGTHAQLAVECGYLGSAQSVDALAGGNSAILVGNSLELAARANLWTGVWQPFVFLGAGATRYDVSKDFTMAANGMRSSDVLFEMPMGAGLAYRSGALVGELRGTFRMATAQDLVPRVTGDYAPMHTWAATATVGRAF